MGVSSFLRRAASLTAIGLCLCGVAFGQRSERLIDNGWKFVKQDVAGAEATEFNDAAWQTVALPHTWNVEDGADGGTYYRGPGWYRRHLFIGPELAGKSLFLRFGAASLVAKVFVDGHPAGTHTGGFAAFCFNVTGLLHPGDNVIAVRVDNTNDPSVTPLSGDFTVYGGIYREVKLVALPPVSISPVDDASSGVYLTPQVESASATVGVRVVLRNATPQDSHVEAICTIRDASGASVGFEKTTRTIPANSSAEATTAVKILHPHRWDGLSDPYLYTATVEVRQGRRILDRIDQTFGLRTFKIDPQTGLWLNGHPYDMHGVNIHQGRPSVGWAATPKMQEEDYRLIRELGCTGVRMAHYQHAEYEYTLADRYGFIVWAELALVNHMTDTPAFRDNAKQQLRELIKQNYNHPSIFLWSMYNEPAIDRKIGDGEWDLVKDLVSLSHELDPNRLTTGAAVMNAAERMNWYMDVTGINRYWGWYDGEASIGPSRLATMLKESKGRTFGISEYGAGASIHDHENHPKHPKTDGKWHPEEWQSEVHETIWATLKDKPWMWCKLLWVMFDFPSDGRNEGDHAGINDKGLMTGDRKVRKDAFFFYKANWTTEPFVYITERRFDPRPAVASDLKVYSNCESVELWVNGVSLGSKSSPDHIFTWPGVALTAGPLDIRAVGKSGGKSVSDSYRVQARADSKPSN